ncbi:MAG: HD domain-containing protein [Euryarchaeota archaeon]
MSSFPWERDLAAFVRRRLRNPNAPPSHGYDHVRRVVSLCEFIGRREGADLEVLLAAAWLHDVGRPEEERTGRDHARISARIAARVLPSLGFPRSKLDDVVHAIEAHRYSSGPEPRTLEARILQDADNLDALGAVGIARCFCVVGERGTSLEDGIRHFHEKLLKLPELMHTETARRLARARVRRLLAFLGWFRDETGMRS